MDVQDIPLQPRLRIPGGAVAVAAIPLPKPLEETIMNLYSIKSNAKRAAVKELGEHAMEGADYRLTKHDGKWTWTTDAKSGAAPGMAETPKGEDTEADGGPEAQPKPRRRREGTKQALLIDMLRRPEGATIAQIVEATDWQRHTARGAISGTVKKKLGLNVTSEKPEKGERVYRIIDAA
jgi:hypothetical protein